MLFHGKNGYANTPKIYGIRTLHILLSLCCNIGIYSWNFLYFYCEQKVANFSSSLMVKTESLSWQDFRRMLNKSFFFQPWIKLKPVPSASVCLWFAVRDDFWGRLTLSSPSVINLFLAFIINKLQPIVLLTAPHTPSPWSNKSGIKL